VLAGTAVVAAAACSGGALAENTPLSNGQSFVSGSYGASYFSPGHRPAAPPLRARTLTGQPFSLRSHRGSVVVLNFWGSWCYTCRQEAPAISALARHFAGAPVRFVGVDMLDTPPAAEAFMRTFGISYPSLNDPGGLVAVAFRATVPPAAIPSTLLIDRAGRIAARVVGEVSYRGLRALITRVLAERA
jgi:thiol-disulfide isomerase/thioredoxin